MANCAQCAVHIACDRGGSYHYALILVWITSKFCREDCKRDCKEDGKKEGNVECRVGGRMKGQAVGDQG